MDVCGGENSVMVSWNCVDAHKGGVHNWLTGSLGYEMATYFCGVWDGGADVFRGETSWLEYSCRGLLFSIFQEQNCWAENCIFVWPQTAVSLCFIWSLQPPSLYSFVSSSSMPAPAVKPTQSENLCAAAPHTSNSRYSYILFVQWLVHSIGVTSWSSSYKQLQ